MSRRPPVPSVIVALDEERTLENVERALKHAGYVVKAVRGGDAAVRAARDHQYDFAVVGLELEQGGLRVAELVKSQSPKVKVVLHSIAALDREMEAKLSAALSGPFGYVCWLAPGSSITKLLSELERLAKEAPKQKCFVIMPFSGSGRTEEEWDALFYGPITNAVESTNRYECTRAKVLTGDVIQEVTRGLVTAEVVIADLTGNNPKVHYELGIRHARGGATVLLSQDRKDPDSLWRPAIIGYEWGAEGFKKLSKAIVAAIEGIEKEVRDERLDNQKSAVEREIEKLQAALGDPVQFIPRAG